MANLWQLLHIQSLLFKMLPPSFGYLLLLTYTPLSVVWGILLWGLFWHLAKCLEISSADKYMSLCDEIALLFHGFLETYWTMHSTTRYERCIDWPYDSLVFFWIYSDKGVEITCEKLKYAKSTFQMPMCAVFIFGGKNCPWFWKSLVNAIFDIVDDM